MTREEIRKEAEETVRNVDLYDLKYADTPVVTDSSGNTLLTEKEMVIMPSAGSITNKIIERVEAFAIRIHNAAIEEAAKILAVKLDAIGAIPNDDPAPTVIVGSMKVAAGLLSSTVDEIRERLLKIDIGEKGEEK